jgi:hypothetical protein
MNNLRRPQTLSEAAAWSDDAEKFSFNIRDFLDEFYADPRSERLMDEPPVRREVLCDNGLADAYVAAIAEHLSRRFGLPTPAWAGTSSRILKHPWFAMQSHGGRMLLLIESPPAFRERNIFVSADALSRA